MLQTREGKSTRRRIDKRSKEEDARFLESPYKLILKVLGHQHIIRCNACLTSIDDFAPQNPLGRGLQIARRIDDHRRFAFKGRDRISKMIKEIKDATPPSSRLIGVRCFAAAVATIFATRPPPGK
jgi:hypothetical protein